MRTALLCLAALVVLAVAVMALGWPEDSSPWARTCHRCCVEGE